MLVFGRQIDIRNNPVRRELGVHSEVNFCCDALVCAGIAERSAAEHVCAADQLYGLDSSGRYLRKCRADCYECDQFVTQQKVKRPEAFDSRRALWILTAHRR